MGFGLGFGLHLGRHNRGAGVPSAGGPLRGASLVAPVGFDMALPVSITRVGPQSYTTDFDPADWQVASSATYYVDPATGNDGNDGQSPATAKKKLSALLALLAGAPPAGGATIVLAPGIYRGSDGLAGTDVAIDCNIVCPSGRAIFQFSDAISWTKAAGLANVWQGPTTRGLLQAVIDKTDTDAFGIPRRLAGVASLGELDTTPGTAFYDSGTLHVHTHDGRAPDGDVVAFSTAISAWSQSSSVQVFLQNIDFWGYAQPVYLDTSAPARFVFDNCSFRYAATDKNGLETGTSSHADTLVICHACDSSYNAYDGFGYRGAMSAVEIDCRAVWNGYTEANANDNGSSAHSNVRSLRVGGTYRFNADRNIHDINSTQNWLVGCVAGEAQNGEPDAYDNAAFLAGRQGNTDATRTFLEGCSSSGGAASDLAAYGNAVVETLDCVGLALQVTDATATIRDADPGIWSLV